MASFYVHPEDVRGDRLTLRGEELHHAVRVRRCRLGELIDVVDGVGGFYQVRVDGLEDDALKGQIVARGPEWGESRHRIALAQSLVKGERFDLVVEKCTEIGVWQILPMVTERSIASPDEPGRRLKRWRRVARAAMKQSKRSRFPSIEAPMVFGDALSALTKSCDLVVIAWEDEKDNSLRDTLRGRLGIERAGILIGPEGGFSQREIQMAMDLGALPFSLGPRRLRSETAGIVSVALLLYELEAKWRRPCR